MHVSKARPGETSRAAETGGATTLVEASVSAVPAGGLQLLVLEPSGLAVYPLPDSGEVRIGRAEDCQVQLRDPLTSRRHATLRTQPLAIEDCGSANGSLLGDRALESGVATPLQLGRAIFIGSSLLIVRRAGAGDAPAVRSEPPTSGRRVETFKPAVVRQPVMKRLYEVVDRLSKGSINILVLGETGVGKEVVAESIHRASPRGGALLVRVNCAALAEPLLESELFGHERGAFTGAVSAKPGLIELADGGTVFLDEVGDLPLSLQAKLLRAIEAREVTRVGGIRPRPSDVRFVSATNRDLEDEVRRGAFRSDLMFRLNGASLEVPPLRARPLEIIPLATQFLERVADQLRIQPPPQLTDEAEGLLLAHTWPGNVRELRNIIERAVLLCDGGAIGPEDLAIHASATLLPSDDSTDASPSEGSTPLEPERDRIARALFGCGGNQSRAAKLLGISRRTLVRKIAQLGLPRPRGFEAKA